MKFLLRISFFLACSFFSFGQHVSVTGIIVDPNNKPIDFANVILLSEDESEILKGTSTGIDGVFTIENVVLNTYILKVTYIGFSEYKQKIVLTGHLDLKTIQLSEASETLDEVNITVKKPTLTREADRLIFNIENTPLVEGNMLQVLRNTPGVVVVGDDITVKNSSPTVYINDRKVHLSSGDLNQLLAGSSANAIKSVEVITNPSARYDAESGVVINIVMSKNLITGYRGTVFGNYTQAVFPRYNAGTNQFFKNEHISFNVNYNYQKDKINRDGDDTVNYLDTGGALDQSWQSITNRNTWSDTHNLNVNFDYFLDDNNTLSLASNVLYLPYFKYRISNNTLINDANGNFLSRFTANNLSKDTKHNLGFDLGFKHQFTKGDVTFNGHYTTYNYERNQGVVSDFYDNNNSFLNTSAFNTNANQDTEIFATRVDYSLPLNEHSNFEAGLKFSNINTESDIAQFDVDVNSGNETLDVQNSDAFNYEEQIYSGYVNYTSGNESYNLNVGLRAEQTNLEGKSPLTAIQNTQDYLELFPNLSFQYNISDAYNVYANYKRSITRPGYADLNPFRFFLNDNYVVVGNPNLVPAFKNHYNIGTSLFDGLLTIEAYYDNYDGAISEIPRQDNDTNIIEYKSVNFDKTVEYGFDFLVDLYPAEDWNVYFVTSFYNIEEETDFGNGFVNIDQWSNYSVLTNNLSLLKDKSLNLYLNLTWIGKNLQGFQVVDDRLFSQFMIAKTVFNKQGTITLSVNDLFGMHNYNVVTQYQNQFNTQYIDIDDRYVRLGFRYKFGNTKLQTNERGIDSEERDRLDNSRN